MTATRDRRSDLERPRRPADGAAGDAPWDERPLFGRGHGFTWWGGVLLALGFAIAGTIIDFAINKTFGRIFQGAYFVGCVGAVCLVRRKNLFGPMVQPPLIIAVLVPSVVWFTSDTKVAGGFKAYLLTLSQPMIKEFPTMALTTVATLLVGAIRLFVQREPRYAMRSSARRPVPTDARQHASAGARPSRDERTRAIARDTSTKAVVSDERTKAIRQPPRRPRRDD